MKRSRAIRMLVAAATPAIWPDAVAALTEPLWKYIEVGKPFPHLRTTTRDGRVLHLPVSDGRATVLAFWSPACGCNTWLPGMLEAANRDADRILIVGLVIHRDAESDAQIRAAHATFPIADVSFEDMPQFFRGGYGLPLTMLIDRSGILREIVDGFDGAARLVHRIASMRSQRR
jgi:hypothetical protein